MSAENPVFELDVEVTLGERFEVGGYLSDKDRGRAAVWLATGMARVQCYPTVEALDELADGFTALAAEARRAGAGVTS